MEWGAEFYGRAGVGGYLLFFVVFIGEGVMRGVMLVVGFECGGSECDVLYGWSFCVWIGCGVFGYRLVTDGVFSFL